MQCSNCAAVLPEENIFCEECGLRLDAEPLPVASGDGREDLILSAECAGITDVGRKRADHALKLHRGPIRVEQAIGGADLAAGESGTFPPTAPNPPPNASQAPPPPSAAPR